MVKLDQTWMNENSDCYHLDDQCLNLEDKNFDQIEQDAFKDISKKNKIKSIKLKGNNLTSFNFQIVKDLNFLEILDLSHNRIVSLVINPSSSLFSFAKSYPLKKLCLNNNQIDSINKDNFNLKRMPDLHTIEIHNNSFREFDASLLKDLKKLTFFMLDYSKQKSFALDKMPEVKFEI